MHTSTREREESKGMLFCLFSSVGQHAALEAIQRGMSPDEKLLAFLDDLFVVSKPQTVETLHSAAQREVWAHCRIRVHGGKTHVWNELPTARVWRGSEVPPAEQGIKVLGTFVGHDEYVRSLLEKIQVKQQFLLNSARRAECVALAPPLRVRSC